MFYNEIKQGAKSYFQILDDVETTFKLYRKLEHHFKGSLFEVADGETIDIECLRLVKKCFISGYENSSYNTFLKIGEYLISVSFRLNY